MNGTVTFVGAGPGAVDLITLRGLRAIQAADLIIYAGSLVNEQLLDEKKPGAECLNSAALNFQEVITQITAAWEQGRQVVRLHTGDPALYGAVAEQYAELKRRGIPFEVVPGVSSVLAAAAALQTEFTIPGVTQSVILTRDAGRTPVPEAESLEKLAAHGTTLCLFLSVAQMPQLVAKLQAAGRSASTPAAVVYRASWPNQMVVRGTLADIAGRVAAAGIKRQAQIIVGEALNNAGELSQLYAGTFSHGYRGGAESTVFRGRTAVFALTAAGVDKAAEIAAGLGPETPVVLPEKYAARVAADRRKTYPDGGFGAVFREAFARYDGIVAVMATGIAVRHLAGLCDTKQCDPAVVVSDERGDHAISLLSGHQGGANALARRVAGITGGRAVITTATDVRGVMAFDELAARHGYRIRDQRELGFLTTLLLDGEPLDLVMPRELFEEYYGGQPNLTRVEPEHAGQIRITDLQSGRTLILNRIERAIGIGCHRGAALQDLEHSVERALREARLAWSDISYLASAALKSDETGLLELARKHDKPLRFFSRDELNGREVENPSAAARKHFGIESVSEAAALLAAGPEARLLLPKHVYEAVTVAIAEAGQEAEGEV